MIQRLKGINYLKIAKITVGAVIAAVVAHVLRLDYAVSAGIICLLTIQDTRKETLTVTLKRLIAFVTVTLLCMAVFGAAGFGFIQLGSVIALFLFICFMFDMNEAVAMNSVIATHYFSSADCSLSMAANEVMLLAVGAGTGVLLNIFIPVNIAKIRRIQSQTDERIKRIIGRMSIYILAEDKFDYTGSCFDETSQLLESLKKESVRYIGNSFGGGKDYFLKYVGMRMNQCDVLMRIYSDIMRVKLITVHAEPISAFLKKTSEEFHEINDAAQLLEELETLFGFYENQPLPQSRTEFESRALMYHILCDLKYLVELKADFSAALSEYEKKRFWYGMNK